jgi:hypothetical protein
VDVTPRHCRAFKPKPGQKLKWTNISVRDGKEVQSGDAAADPSGLATLPKVVVGKGRNRLSLRSSP